MKRVIQLGLLPAVLLSLSLSVATQTPQQPRDGKWWQGLEQSEKYLHVIGMIDGARLGQEFVLAEMSKGKNGIKGFSDAFDAYEKAEAKYLGKLTSGEIAQGLDAFYADYKNRRIWIHDATFVVLMGISGVPQAQIEKRVEAMRRESIQ